jgi:hypothetical protein
LSEKPQSREPIGGKTNWERQTCRQLVYITG